MPVPYGFGVGDFVAVGTLAWTVYKSCKAAPGSFDNVSLEVLSLHAVLKEGEETLLTRPLPPERAERLKVVKEGCEKVLLDLQSLVKKYESLGTQSKRTWDRMRWGNEDIAEIRARLTANISMLAAFISTSQISVETKLDKFIDEFRRGKRESSVVSLQTVDSLSADERAVWRTIRKELEDIGISVAAFEANRNFIFEWFVSAVATGAFDEHNGDVSDDMSNSSHSHKSRNNEDPGGRGKKQPIESTHFESFDSMKEHQPLIMQMSPRSAHDAEENLSKGAPETFDQVIESEPPATRTSIPRVAALFAGLSRPRQRLIKAVDRMEVSKALKILRDEASFQLLDLRTLNKALWMISCQKGDSDILVAELIARGCDVNYISVDFDERTPLWNSVVNESFEIVQLLVQNGADVNYMGAERPRYFEDLRNGAPDFAARQALIPGKTAILRFLLSSGVNVNARYKPRDDTEFSLIHEAVLLEAFAAIEALLEYRADIDIVSSDHGTALMLALSSGKEDLANFLLAYGADPNFGAGSQQIYHALDGAAYRSPIEAAIIGRRFSMIKSLLDRGVVPDDSILEFAKSVLKSRGSIYSEDGDIMRLLKDVTFPF